MSKPVQVPFREAIGALLYVALGTRPDISYCFNVLSRFCSNPKLSHYNGIKRIFRYFNHTKSLRSRYNQAPDLQLEAFSDAEWAGCLETRRTTNGIVLLLNNAPVVWRSVRQTITATSTCEAE